LIVLDGEAVLCLSIRASSSASPTELALRRRVVAKRAFTDPLHFFAGGLTSLSSEGSLFLVAKCPKGDLSADLMVRKVDRSFFLEEPVVGELGIVFKFGVQSHCLGRGGGVTGTSSHTTLFSPLKIDDAGSMLSFGVYPKLHHHNIEKEFE